MHIYKPNCKCPKDDKGKRKCKCDANWAYLVDAGINPQTGKRKQKFKGGFSTKKEAVTAAGVFMQEFETGVHIKESDITFEDYAEKQWILWYASTTGVKISTLRVRKNEVDRLKKYFAKMKMRDITKQQYQNALNSIKTVEGAADSTLDGIHGTGKMIFRRAVQQDTIKTDPTQYAYVPKQQKTVEELEKDEEPEKYMERDELLLFLHAAKFKGLERDYVIFFLLANTGLRAGELCALKWSDIDFNEQIISITKTIYNPNYNTKAYTLLPPKTPSSRRKIAVDEELLEVLRQHKGRQDRIRDSRLNTYHDNDFVIAKMEGRNMGYPEFVKTIGNRMARLIPYAGLDPSLTPHSLRHTHTSLLAAAGIPLHEIMERLGHKDDKVTREVYLHVTKERKKEAPLGISAILKGASTSETVKQMLNLQV